MEEPFCGWLCPFGALQEIINICSQKLGIIQIKIRDNIHRKLIYFKYIILFFIIAFLFIDLDTALLLTEIEPFKTSITLKFYREFPYVIYVIILLLCTVFVSRFYCRYICPLGAVLALGGRFRLINILIRRKECGSPCHLCETSCPTQAIKNDGKIDMIDEDLDGHADHRVTGNDFVEGIRVSDGKLSLHAQLRLTRTQEALEVQRRTALTDLFHAIDAGGDGSIEEEELVEFLSKIFPPSDNKDMQDKQIKMMIQGLDEDGDGDVTLPEFLHMMEPIVIRAEMEETSDEVCERMFQMLDDDQSDSVSISEFLEMLRKVGMDMSYEEVRDLFNEYDDSNDGAIDLEEFQKMMAHQL